MPSTRAVTPVVGAVFAIVIVGIVSASIAVVTVDAGSQLSDPTPTVAFDTEVDENVTLTHTNGQTLDAEQIEVHGGEPKQLPSEIQAGDTIAVDPSGEKREIKLVWTDEQSSAPLVRVDLIEAYQEQTPTETEPERPAPGSCQFSSETTVDGNGDCVTVLGTETEHVENTSEVIIFPPAAVETVTDTNNVWLKPQARITGTVDVDNNIYLEHRSSEITGSVEGGTVIEDY